MLLVRLLTFSTNGITTETYAFPNVKVLKAMQETTSLYGEYPDLLPSLKILPEQMILILLSATPGDYKGAMEKYIFSLILARNSTLTLLAILVSFP